MDGLKIGKKCARVPVIQGGMGIGISLGRLAGTVAKEGGVGIISAAQIGFKEPDFDTDTKAANLRAIKKEYDRAREISPDGVVGFNLMVAMRHYEDYVRAAVEAGADLIVSGAGLPTDLPGIVGDADVSLAPIVSTEKSAKVILKYWDRKYNRIPDLLVIEGPMAGGHLGFAREQLEKFMQAQEEQPAQPERQGQLKELSQPGGSCKMDSYAQEVARILAVVKEYEKKYGKKIPTALGGGIDTAEAAKEAFSLGVDAVQVATRFVATEECDADIRYKESYLNAKKEDIIIVKSPVGMPGRAVRNELIERVERGERIPHSPCHRCLNRCDPARIPYCITDALIHAAKGELSQALLFCGANAYKEERIGTVREVMEDLTKLL